MHDGNISVSLQNKGESLLKTTSLSSSVLSVGVFLGTHIPSIMQESSFQEAVQDQLF